MTGHATSTSTQLLAFGETLKQLQARARELAACLERENALLGQPDVNALHRLNGEKSGLLIQLEALDQKRGQLLAALGYGDDIEGMKRFLAEAPEAFGLQDIWHQTRAALESCQHLNQVNGGAIELRRRHTQQTLTLLRGSATDDLYNQRGHNYNKPDGRWLAKA